MRGRPFVKKGAHPVRPWFWTHPACRASAGRGAQPEALADLCHHLRVCPGHP